MRRRKGASDSAVLADALSLVMEAPPSSRQIAQWSKVQRGDAWRWVTREILIANDHILPSLKRPACLEGFR